MTKEERANAKEIVEQFTEICADNEGTQVPVGFWNTTAQSDEEFWGVNDFEAIEEEIQEMFEEEMKKYHKEVVRDYTDPTIGYNGIAWKIR